MGNNEKVTVRFETSEVSSEPSNFYTKVDSTGTPEAGLQYYTKSPEGDYIPCENLTEFVQGVDYYCLNYDVNLSGPVDIIAAIDKLYEGDTDYSELSPTRAEFIGEGYSVDSDESVLESSLEEFGASYTGTVYLYSWYITQLAKIQYHKEKSVVIYVKDVRNENPNEDNQDHRGAYFKLKGFNENFPLWQEILLGTHTHENIVALENLTRAVSEAPLGKSLLIIANKDGTFSFNDASNSVLPNLPADVLEKIEEIKKAKAKYEYPEDVGEHHLDAPLDELTETYDWLNNTQNISGSCQDLYRELKKAGKKLYLNSDFTVTAEKNLCDTNLWVDLFQEKVAFESDNPSEIIHLEYDKINGYYVNLPVEGASENNDNFFIFDGENIVPRTGYDIIKYDKVNGILSLKIVKNKFKLNTDVHEISVLVVHNGNLSKSFEAKFIDAAKNGDVKLYTIHDALGKLYFENEVNKIPNLPHYYLTTDSSGNLIWDNKFTPTQQFYHQQYVLTQEYIDKNSVNGILKVTFPNAYYTEGEDFPLLMIDEMYAFDEKIHKAGGDVYYEFKLNNNDPNVHYNIDPGTKLTLVIIKPGSGKSLADELADKYISKKDAVNILSNHKINLDDYVTKNDLSRYATKFHTHAGYASKNHNHDERYANFHHTHPELYLALAQIIGNGVTAEDIQHKVDKINEDWKKWYDIVIDKFDKLDDGAVNNSDELISSVNQLVKSYNENTKDDVKLPELSSGSKLTDALKILAEVIKRGDIKDNEVLLSDKIDAKVDNGNIGGIVNDVTYPAGTPLRQILLDILDPYYDLQYVRKQLTPSQENTKLHWYVVVGKIGEGDNIKYEFEEVDISKLNKYTDYEGELWFSIEPLNEYNKELKFKNQSAVVFPEMADSGGNFNRMAEIDGKYQYSEYVNFKENVTMNDEIRVFWESTAENDVIFDSAGNTETGLEGKLNNVNDRHYLKYNSENVKVAEDPVDVYCNTFPEGTSLASLDFKDFGSNDDINSEGLKINHKIWLGENDELYIDTTPEKSMIILLVNDKYIRERKAIQIYDTMTGLLVLDTRTDATIEKSPFEIVDVDNFNAFKILNGYTAFKYVVDTSGDIMHTLRVRG